MLVATLGDFLWSLLIIFFMIVYFMMLFWVVLDIFRRHDASGWKKAAWLVFLLVLPLIGLLAYMISNSESMAHRNAQEAQRSKDQFDDYVRNVGGGSADQIEKAKGLLDSGAITQAEFEQIKAKALA